MSNINGFSIATLVLFFLSTIFVINPISFHVRLPVIRRTKVTIGLMTAPILTILLLWAAQCIGANQIRDGIVGIGTLAGILSLLCKLNQFSNAQMESNLTISSSFLSLWRTCPLL